MTHILELTERVQTLAPRFKKCPDHQQLVYAVESIVGAELPAPTVDLWGAQAFIADVANEIGADIPEIVREKISDRFVACASHERYVIVLGASTVSTLTLCHEFAHLLVSKTAGHRKEWRNQFVNLARSFVSCEHGALLVHLYNRVGLDTHWNQ